MRNLLALGVSLGLSLGCGGDSGSATGTTPGGATTTSSTGTSGAGATSTAAAAGKGATSTTAAGTPAGSGAKAGAGAPVTSTTATTAAGSGAAGSGAAGGGAATSSGATAAAGASGGAAGGGAASSGTGTGAGSCGPENTNPPEMLDKMGPWAPMHVESTGPAGQSWVFFPADLGKDGMKHPVFDWGPGAATGPADYVDHLNLLASQGFVIISQPSTASGTEALDWILAENDKQGSMWYQKLDTTRVGQGGHSMGALLTLSESKDPRLSLYVLVCGGCMGNGCGAKDFHAPSIFLGGEGEGGTENFEKDYAEVATSPSYFVTKTDTDHIYCARNNLAPWVAFMRMNWCGEKDKYQKDLLDGGTFCKAPWIACKSKNTM